MKDIKTLAAIIALLFIFKLILDPGWIGRAGRFGPLAFTGHIHLPQE